MSFVLLGLEPATYYHPQVATLVQLPRSNSVSASFPSSFSGVGFTLASGMLFRSIALAVTHVFPPCTRRRSQPWTCPSRGYPPYPPGTSHTRFSTK